jgi:hypothetical protein
MNSMQSILKRLAEVEAENESLRSTVTRLETFEISTQTFSCCMLNDVYTFRAQDISWIVFLREKLTRMIMLELVKTGDMSLIATTLRAELFSSQHQSCPLLRLRPQWKRPVGWECVDHMIPAWLDEWKVVRNDSIGLGPHSLTFDLDRSKTLPRTSHNVDHAPPLTSPPRTGCASTSRLSSRPRPAPLLSSRSDEFPLSLRKYPARGPRSVSFNDLNPSEVTPTRLQTSISSTHRITSAQPGYSKSGSPLPGSPFVSLSSRTRPALSSTPSKPQLARSATAVELIRPTISPRSISLSLSKPQETQTIKNFSVIHRRPNAFMPSSLDLSPAKSAPLVPDLLTPPPDPPLPNVFTGHRSKRSALYFPSHLSWSSFEETGHDIGSSSGSTGSEGTFNWI